MKINTTNIKSMLGITSTDYDTKIENLIPQLLDSICEYCRNDFILKGNSGFVYDNVDMTIDETTITLTTDLPIKAYDFIRLYNTDYNNGMYQVAEYESGIITIDSTKEMVDESTIAIVALVKFPSEFLQMIANYIDSNVVNTNTGNVKIEEIDDTKVEYFDNSKNASSDIASTNFTTLNKYRKLIKINYFGDVV